MRTNNYQQALDVLDRLLSTPSNSAALHWCRSQCLAKLNRPEDARDAVETVLRLRSNFVPALMLRVKLARDHGELFDSERLLRRVLLLEPQRARAQYWLADVLLHKQSDSQEALALLNACIASSPNLLRARLRRADYYWMRYSKALKKMRDESQGEYALPAAQAAIEMALVDYQFVAEHGHSNRATLRSAKALARLGRAPEMIPYLDTLLARLPADAPTRQTIAQLRERVSKREPAAEEQTIPKTLMMPSTLLAENSSEPSAGPASWLEEVVQVVKRVAPVVTAPRRAHPTDDALALQYAKQLFSDAFEPGPDVLEVKLSEFQTYQVRYLEQRSKQLQALGCTFLGDVAPKKSGQAHGVQPVMRVFRHAVWGIVWVYAIRPQWAGGVASLIQAATGHWRVQRNVQALAMLSQDVFVATHMGGDASINWGGRQYRYEALPENFHLKKMVKQHEKCLKHVWSKHPGAQLIVPQTLQEFQAQWRIAMQAKKASRSQAPHWVTETELRALLGKRYDRLHEKVQAHFQALMSDAQ